jgi:hypothetical protein
VAVAVMLLVLLAGLLLAVAVLPVRLRSCSVCY